MLLGSGMIWTTLRDSEPKHGDSKHHQGRLKHERLRLGNPCLDVGHLYAGGCAHQLHSWPNGSQERRSAPGRIRRAQPMLSRSGGQHPVPASARFKVSQHNGAYGAKPCAKAALNVCGSTPGAAAAGAQLTIKRSTAIGIASRSETSLCNVRLKMIVFI
jgi:hypothetical protein